MPDTIRIKRGLDIPLGGTPSQEVTQDRQTKLFAIYPDDYPGPVWKAAVKPGDRVEAGAPLLVDKSTGRVFLVSPVSGVIKEINRGERRHICYISVEKTVDEENPVIGSLRDNAEDIKEALLASGLWAMMRQRPYDIVPEVEVVPRDIFVTAFDSAPLAGDLIEAEDSKWLEEGFKALSTLTSGSIYLGKRPEQKIDSKIAKIYNFEGPHPAGNVGTQISAIKPVNTGETVWTVDAMTVVRIGKLCSAGEMDFSTLVSVTGPIVKNPHIVKTTIGAEIKGLLEGFLNSDKGLRIISGNVLTGVKVSADGFLHYPYRQITVIEEGDNADEFMGWASMNPGKYSVKRNFPAFLRGLSKPFDFDARIKGGKRAMILSGEYDKVFPFDIYPEYLLKAIIAKDIDRMEKLGIYEIAPEDFALPEFVDTSKQELQKTVREGLDYLRKELS